MVGYKWKKNIFDTNILGFECVKIESIQDKSFVKDLIDDLKKSNIDYAIFRVEAQDFELIHELEINNFLLVDGSLSLSCDLPTTNLISDKITLATENDIDKILRIATDSFKSTRFFNDSLISKKKAKDIYKKWMINSLSNKTDKVFVYKNGNIIAGFISLNNNHISLIAVDNSSQGKGIAGEMINYALVYISHNKHKKAFIETQFNNIAALRVYQKSGFRIIKSFFTFRVCFMS